MYNSTNTNTAELPSTQSLIKATLGAFTVAVVLTVTVVLPAEFGIDMTGVGRIIGLQEMGDIKVSLAEEAIQEDLALQASSVNQAAIAAVPVAKAAAPVVKAVETVALSSDSRTIELKNGAAAELKVALKKGQTVSYSWTSSDKINFDNHGDSSSIDYLRYSKGVKVTNDSGKIVAGFDGYHGWFWRNRSGKSVTINIQFEGEYSEVK